jgi:bis(5'-nucleosyl)-tetraphosphatase (symmetrical)
MAVYAIGDVQGCFDELLKLLDHINFDPVVDQIWLAGDLVNRGPRSADVLRFAMDLGSEKVKVVLGNHDLHLLANAAGVIEHQHRMDTMDSVLRAADREHLVTWLRHQPLFHHDSKLGFSMVHAGLPAEWSITEASERSKEVEAVLQGDNWRDFFSNMYGNKPKAWSVKLEGWDRLRFITNCFTRLRYCYDDGRLALKFKGAPKDKPTDQKPWFEMPNRASKDDRIVFGHWSTLGTGQYGNVFSLDSGAVWGEKLTAVRIDTEPYQWFTIDADPEGLPHAKNKATVQL